MLNMFVSITVVLNVLHAIRNSALISSCSPLFFPTVTKKGWHDSRSEYYSILQQRWLWLLFPCQCHVSPPEILQTMCQIITYQWSLLLTITFNTCPNPKQLPISLYTNSYNLPLSATTQASWRIPGDDISWVLGTLNMRDLLETSQVVARLLET